MSGSKYEYVRAYERPDTLLPNAFLLLRIDGHAFHKFSDKHGFRKPNDERALQLMDRAAQAVMDEYPDVVLGFGESDEYSFPLRFLIRRKSNLYSRRESKLVSLLVSLFTSAFVFHWPTYFPALPPPEASDLPALDYPTSFERLRGALQPRTAADEGRLLYPPTFDGRVVCYPTEKEVRDYFAWRQVDTHVNNLYNTTFWALILLPPVPTPIAVAVPDALGHSSLNDPSTPPPSGLPPAPITLANLQPSQMTPPAAHKLLQGSFSKDKHEMLFRRGVSYGRLGEREKKGSVLVRADVPGESTLDAVDVFASPPSADALASSSKPPTPSADPPSSSAPSNPPVPTPAHWTNRKLRPKKPKSGAPSTAAGAFDGTSGRVQVLHVDVIQDEFWEARPWLLA